MSSLPSSESDSVASDGDTAEGSSPIRDSSRAVSLVRAAWNGSRVGRAIRERRTDATADDGTSAPAVEGSTLVSWVRASRTYRWFTTEPDPIVVDLRDVRLVVGLVATVAAIREWYDRTVGNSAVGDVGHSLVETVEERPIRAVSILLIAAVASNTLATAVVGDITAVSLSLRSVVAAAALAGLRFG